MAAFRIHTICIIGILGSCLFSGCAPSQADKQEIISRLKNYEATRQKQLTYPNEKHRVYYETSADQSLEKAKITVFGNQANARYSKIDPMSQFTSIPTKMNLKKIDGQWTIVSETKLYPVWPHRELKTVPIK